MCSRVQAPDASERPWSVIWIDSRTAVVARWDGADTSITRKISDVPAHRRSTGRVAHDPGIRHGGGGAPMDTGEARRLEHLNRFLHEVAATVEPYDEVEVLGPGIVHERLAAMLEEIDAGHRHDRHVAAEPAGPMTDAQIVAHLRSVIGRTPPRGLKGRRMAPPRRSRRLPPELMDEETG